LFLFQRIGQSKSATFQSARNLALGIGIQNFPEGLAVSLPLYASGYSYLKSFWYGQLSGMVEPVASVIGVLSVGVAQACLPYALSFAAGAMLYVVFENLMPEAASHGNGKLSTWSCLVGFCIMMSLDAGLN
jgi:zinc transporter 11